MKTYELHNMLRKDIETLAANDALKHVKGQRVSTIIASGTPRGAQAFEWYMKAYYREMDFWEALGKVQR